MSEQSEAVGGEQTVPAAVLAGGGATDRVAAAAPCKGLVEVEDRPLVEWVLDALNGAQLVSEVVIVEGPTRPISATGRGLAAEVISADGDGFIDTLTAAAQALDGHERFLVATGDLPMLTPEAVDGFVRSCQESQAEVLYPLVKAEDINRAFPGRGKRAVRLREGRFVGANLAMLSRRFVLEEGPTIATTFARRKNPLTMAGMFGWWFVVRLLTGRLSAADLERRASEMLGAKMQAVPTQWPEIGFDVDDARDLALARRYVSERRGG
ncbi:MAG: nucleotidyltransferase family protein [Armatimonadota bacterium]|nr:nucleotidyltransferase family protein [Armatimonadota bacterium]